MTQTRTLQEAVREILQSVGEDPQRQGLRGTPERVARLYLELFSGVGRDPLEEFTAESAEGQHGAVALRGIPFSSMCEHHLLPFFGSASIGYLPEGRVAGLSKIVRVLEVLARRPQLQERLTNQVADALYQALAPAVVAVVLNAEHLCLSIRGVQKPGTRVVTYATRGGAAVSSPGREELLALLRGT
ncbi:MAG: GTP cyclohydrolase I FolE [Chloroflexi bacterium]|nr:GTP cyclohydrolase I FolE [Chloroflexota bacterium]